MTEDTSPRSAAAEAIPEQAPDEIHPLLRVLMDNLKYILWGVGALVLVVAVYGGWDFYTMRKQARAEAEMGMILVKADGKDRLAALDDFLGRAPESMRLAVLLEKARTAHEVEDFAAAEQAWDEVANHAKEPGLAVVARLGAAKAVLMAGNAMEALERLRALRPQVPADLSAAVTVQLAVAAEAAGQWQEAMAAYQDLMNNPESADRPYLERKVAELRAKMDKKG